MTFITIQRVFSYVWGILNIPNDKGKIYREKITFLECLGNLNFDQYYISNKKLVILYGSDSNEI